MINNAVAELAHLPLSNRLLRRTHAILMQGVRGESKQPGEFRSAQNWIGGAGPIDAAFVPPAAMEVAELMSDLEKFLHNQTIIVPYLVRAAIALLRDWMRVGVLREITGQQRGRIYAFQSYLELFIS